MSEQTPTLEPVAGLEDSWKMGLEAAVCERCDWTYLLPKGSLPQRCPHCFSAELSTFEEGVEHLPYTRPPELIVPFSQPVERLAGMIDRFAHGIPFAPSDLSAANLKSRLRKVYLPAWLVDANIQATWEAEAGFNYEVVSHQDRFDENRGGWASREVREGRVRWEPRAGRLTRAYQNISARALEEDAAIRRAIGGFSLQGALPYGSQPVGDVFIRLPNRAPEGAWSDARPAFQAAAADECRQAASADHIRQFQWQPQFENQNWTLLLSPLYTSFYLDDERRPQVLFINGATGQLSGARRASMKRAQTTALIILGVAMALFVISLVLTAFGAVAPPLLPIGGVGIFLALLVALCAAIPPIVVWNFNRKKE